MEILTPVGRIVGGHPMLQHAVIDQMTNQPRMMADKITPMMQTYIGLAIPKGVEQHWNQTEWGAKIHATGVEAWPNGEHGAATFAWKITDGDSVIPNKKSNKPCDREGYPGHWVINFSTSLPVKCYHVGKYDPLAQIQDSKEIKAGDYGRVVAVCKGNNATQSPGVYMNPNLFELVQAGQAIILDTGTPASEAFATPAAMPAGVATQQPVAQPPVAPHSGILTPPAPTREKTYDVGGQQYSHSQLVAAGWSEQQIAALGQ